MFCHLVLSLRLLQQLLHSAPHQKTLYELNSSSSGRQCLPVLWMCQRSHRYRVHNAIKQPPSLHRCLPFAILRVSRIVSAAKDESNAPSSCAGTPQRSRCAPDIGIERRVLFCSRDHHLKQCRANRLKRVSTLLLGKSQYALEYIDRKTQAFFTV